MILPKGQWLCALLLLLCWTRLALAFDTTFWVWHRTTPLSVEEVGSLDRQSVRKLYWHAATLQAQGARWQMMGSLQLPSKAEASPVIVPVLRLSAESLAPLDEATANSISEWLNEALHCSGASEVQIDFDCPDRRLGEYAAFLAQCRARIAPARLSATAHANWSRLPAFDRLQASVDGLMPMFYDLESDSAAAVRDGKVLPLVDVASIAKQLDSWRACRVPWSAGLPNFARVTIFDLEGRSRGHLRAWDWDAICFNPALRLRTPPILGVTQFVVDQDTVVADTPVKKGETVACRLPDPVALAEAIAAAKNTGAAGVAIFRLPGAGSQGGWSLRQLETLSQRGCAGQPDIHLRRAGNGLEIVNASEADLPPRLSGPDGSQDRGYQIEMESTAGAVFREATPGEFANVFAHVDPETAEPRRVEIPLGQRLTYWFADLRAGQSRQTGLLQLAPGIDFTTLRWRWRDGSRVTPWQPLR